MLLSSLLALATVSPLQRVEGSREYMSVSMKTQSGLPVVRATVSGKPLNLILDLGGYKGLALTKTALAGLQVEYDSRVEQWRNSAGETFTARLFSAPNVKLGDQPVGTVEGIEYGSTIPGVDGYVGLAVLRNFNLVLDYPGQELRLYPADSSGLDNECGAENRVPLQVVNGVSEVEVATEAGKLTFQVDTGASENVLRPSALGLDADTPTPSHVFSRFEFGGKDHGRTRFPLREFVAPNVDGVLGNEFLGSRRVCIDFNRMSATIP